MSTRYHAAVRVLGVETTCDETAFAVVEDGRVLGEAVASQVDLHAIYGGVVPEIAGRAHLENLTPTLHAALDDAGLGPDEIDAVAVANRPGLIGCLHVGLAAAKAFSWSRGLPLVGVNHVHAHLHAVTLDAPPADLPAVGLVVSGGHTSLYHVRSWTDIEPIGRTIDDAVGEAYDKVAAMLGLGYPGGPVVDRLARLGDPDAVALPSPRLGPMDLSFSGIKTAVLYHLRDLPDAERAALLAEPADGPGRKADLCASFQKTVVDALVRTLREAMAETGAKAASIVGGVAANSGLRAEAQKAADADGFELFVPPIGYCVDNAAMIAVAGAASLGAGHTADLSVSIDPNLRIDRAA
jgi:N6-L-threonylcarbamoyladenine synthase